METGIDINRISSAVGYKLQTIDTRTVSPNAPIRIGVLAEVSTEANDRTTPPVDLTPWVVTSIKDAGLRYGYDSQIMQILDGLMPLDGSGVDPSIIEVYPVKEATGAVAKQTLVTVTGTATVNADVTIYVNGQSSQRGKSYTVSVTKGDTATVIAGKIRDVINNNVYCPYNATSALGVVTLTTTWKGKSANYCNIDIDINNTEHGITYVVSNPTAGAGIDVALVNTALGLVGSKWVNIFVTGWALNEPTYTTAYQDWNGKPDNNSPTGRFAPLVNKPALFFVGSIEDDIRSLTNDNSVRDFNTVATCVLPNEKYLPSYVASSYAVKTVKIAQTTPHRDLLGSELPNIQCRYGLGTMSNVQTIDDMVKSGQSTITKSAGKAYIVDFVTTFHPLNDDIPSYRFVRNNIIDWQIMYDTLIYEQGFIKGYTIVNDDDIVRVQFVTKPSIIKTSIKLLMEGWQSRALIADLGFAEDSLVVALSPTNPDRVGINFKYKRSGTARILDNVASVGFNFGTI